MTAHDIVYACDISDMGVLRLYGSDCEAFLKTMFSGAMGCLEELFGVSQGLILNGQGQVIDLVSALRTGDSEFLLLCTASNSDEVFEWLSAHAELADDNGPVFGDTHLENDSEKMAIMALYGSGLEGVLQALERACGQQQLYLKCDFAKKAYGIPFAPGCFLFVPMQLAESIGDVLQGILTLEVLNYDEYRRQLLDNGCLCEALEEGEYSTPQELGLMDYLRDGADFVGARAVFGS